VTLAVFLLLALSAQRAIVWWGMVAPVVVAGLMPERPRATVAEKPTSRGAAAPAYAIVAALLIGVAVLAPWWRGSSYDRFLAAAPPGLTDAARALPAGTRVLVHQPWGSWFEYELPELPVFVDSRIEIVPKDIWHDYGQVGFAGADWKDVLDRWDVQAIVAASDWDLLEDLKDDPDWRVAYSDEDGYLFVRR
jgi:hypothetical protein